MLIWIKEAITAIGDFATVRELKNLVFHDPEAVMIAVFVGILIGIQAYPRVAGRKYGKQMFWGGLTAFCIAWSFGPIFAASRTAFSFSYLQPNIQSAEERKDVKLPGWRFSIGVDVAKSMSAANAYVTYSEQFIKGKWEPLIASHQSDKLEWDAYERGYDPKDLTPGDLQQIVLFHYGVVPGKLAMTNERDEAELHRLKDIKPGEYRFVIKVVSGRDAGSFLSETVHVWWYAAPNTIRIELEDPS